MQLSNIPAKFNIPWGHGAGAGYIRPIPTASQIGITNGAASLTDGFPPLTFLPESSGGVPPFGQDANGILNEITSWNQWQQAGGAVPYDATFQTAIGGYPKGAVVMSGATAGLFFLSTADNNTTDPDTGGAGWTTYSCLSSLGTSGYIKLPTGLIVQWLSFTANGSFSSVGVPSGMYWTLNSSMSWPIAFPTACIGVYGYTQTVLNEYISSIGTVPSVTGTGPVYVLHTQNVTQTPVVIFGVGY